MSAPEHEQAADVIPLFGGRRGESMPPPQPWISKRELAHHLRVSERTIERWMHDPAYARRGQQCPYRKPFANGLVRFRLTEVEAWLAEPA